MRGLLAISLLVLGLATAGLSAQEEDPWGDDDPWAGEGEQGEDPWSDDWGDSWEEENGGVVVTGFAELGAGARLGSVGPVDRRTTLGELRLRGEAEWTGDWLDRSLEAKAVGDVWYDTVTDDLEVEVRNLTLVFSPVADIDVTLGRQVLTWGTGDLLFLNDLFPKDFVSFFAGRDDEYLKAPSDTLRAGFYGGAANVEVAWTPRFQPDEYLTGERFSFFSPRAGTIVAPDPPIGALEPRRYELALRVYRTVRGVEYAGYGYHGYFKQPTAVDADGRLTFAPLTSVGASVRLPLWSGLFNAEFAWYESRDDANGDDPSIPNSQLRFLAGFERELVANFTAGFQYYVEHTRDHDALLENSPTPEFEPEEYRHVLTNRLTYRISQDRWTLSLFTFYSPSDADFYLRPSVSFRQSDEWQFTAGGNWFGGRDDYTFFGQLEDNTNLYVRVRYNY
ncbi:MAG: hypothetical protein P8172_09305 [Gammaproteobacteria bacterium]